MMLQRRVAAKTPTSESAYYRKAVDYSSSVNPILSVTCQ